MIKSTFSIKKICILHQNILKIYLYYLNKHIKVLIFNYVTYHKKRMLFVNLSNSCIY